MQIITTTPNPELDFIRLLRGWRLRCCWQAQIGQWARFNPRRIVKLLELKNLGRKVSITLWIV